ncbi:MAG TPA: hypothetical protein DEB25_06205 [Desulfobulbaceae bacterium]|nr:hypothetical protein [Desulfobulbaceae bacterium]
MHKSFYGLDCEPFDLQPDPTFLWMGEKYREALSVLRYGILDNKGFVLLTGESGVGKTTLLRALTESLPPDILWAFIANPNVLKMEMFNIIGQGFGMNKEYNSKVEFMLDFQAFLKERHGENKKMLLIVDSAHLISEENLEELRLLSNIEQDDAKLLHIFFSAQPSFNATLTRPGNDAIRQRLNLIHTIEPLTALETSDYIKHRFSVAGAENRILTEKAIRSVHHFSGGIPKKINVICQQLLIEGAKRKRRIIDQGAVQECMRRFTLPDNSIRMDSAAGPARGRGDSEESFNPRMLVIGISALALLAAGAGYFFWWQPIPKSQTVPVVATTTPMKTDAPSAGAVNPQININNPVATGPATTPAASNTPGNSQADNDLKENQAARSEPSSKTDTTAAQPELAAATHPQAANDGIEEVIIIKPSQQKIRIAPLQQDAKRTVSAKALPRLKAILPLRANSLSLTDEGHAELADFVRKFKEAGQGKIEVRGYVSSDNAAPANTRLSIRRAEAVRDMLMDIGVDRASIKVRGMGIQNPLADNDTLEGRSKNRRVELEIIP